MILKLKLVHTNPRYARIQHVDGREATVSLRRLAPLGNAHGQSDSPNAAGEVSVECGVGSPCELAGPPASPSGIEGSQPPVSPRLSDATNSGEDQCLCRSSRVRARPDRYDPSSY